MSENNQTTPQQNFTPPRPNAPREKGGSGCLIAGIVLAVVLVGGGIVLVGLLLVGISAAAGKGGQFATGTREGAFRFREVPIRDGGPAKIAVIPVEGMIASGEFAGAGDPVQTYRAQLDRALQDKTVRAVILTINSPGGGITATDIMHRATVDFKKRSGLPVVACMMDVAASGGYYLACASDEIVCHSSTLTGSIGVLMPLYDVTGLMDKVGVKAKFVTSGKHKNMASPFIEKPEDVQQAEIKMLNDMVQQMYDQFVTVVAEGREMSLQKVRELADGRVYTGRQAKELGLADKVGYFEDAVAAAEKRAGVVGAKVVVYRRIFSFMDIIGGHAEARRRSALTVDDLLRHSVGRPPFGGPLYLWIMPGTPASAGHPAGN